MEIHCILEIRAEKIAGVLKIATTARLSEQYKTICFLPALRNNICIDDDVDDAEESRIHEKWWVWKQTTLILWCVSCVRVERARTHGLLWPCLLVLIYFFVRSHCQDVCVTHTKTGTKRRWPTCTSRCWTVVFVHLLNDDKVSRSLLDSCITIINDCTRLSLHHVAKCNACSGKGIDGIIFLVQHVLVLQWVLFWELSLHAKTWLANRLFSLMAANTSLIT